MFDERTYLKIKIKSLAAESKIIRLEEKRAKRTSIRDGLAEHRKGIVRIESRHTHLAYGFLRGKEYRDIEKTAHEAPNWDKVRSMIQKYGIHSAAYESGEWAKHKENKAAIMVRFDDWIKAAQKSEVAS
jgi:hypothetical protein